MTGTRNSLDAVGIFKDLDHDVLARIEERCRWRTFRAHQEILAFKDPSTEVYFLTAGRARVVIYSPDGKSVNFSDLEAGRAFGEFSAIDGQGRSASVEALEPCTVGIMSSGEFRELLLEQPAAMMALLTQIIQETRRLAGRVYEYSTLPVRTRIRLAVLRIAREHANGQNSVLVRPMLKNAEIAALISTHREAVSRQISQLAQLGVIERDGTSDIRVPDIERLAKLVHEETGEEEEEQAG